MALPSLPQVSKMWTFRKILQIKVKILSEELQTAILRFLKAYLPVVSLSLSFPHQLSHPLTSPPATRLRLGYWFVDNPKCCTTKFTVGSEKQNQTRHFFSYLLVLRSEESPQQIALSVGTSEPQKPFEPPLMKFSIQISVVNVPKIIRSSVKLDINHLGKEFGTPCMW